VSGRTLVLQKASCLPESSGRGTPLVDAPESVALQRNTTSALLAFGSEFFAPLPLFAVGLFAVNNWVLKSRYPGWVTGKLSDIAACFFLPLFLSAFVDLVSLRKLRLRSRLAVGATLTIVGFSAVKLSKTASDGMTFVINALNRYAGLPMTENRVDPSDLIALPFVAVALWWARRR
jgi:hypothetical protein